MRKIIQFCVVPESIRVCGFMTALCDDGTMWCSSLQHAKWLPWERVSAIPQDAAEGDISDTPKHGREFL